uniref:ribosomal RNA processing protein 1 homolog A-like n=1 Tax=Doryrhamphus excisus TaxID=161450 RepID=UPI0025AEBF12|nr:ribosomal RNA processing protein 1 homolog A-like [Doryrhamphus excisus]
MLCASRELYNMAAVQEQEIQLAQKLAANEKPIRTKALRKLRKYINLRSQKSTDGFTSEELLKLWKGLFYCLWMQDKPLLQEELSNSISTLIHSFHDVNGQFLYLESSLKTFKREWTGIDRLRMDKVFQLVRFMFRQTFEMLKRKNWECSVVARFLELLRTELLQVGSNAPTGLQLHVLDLYLTELAVVGSAELTAEQNLIFLEPFCNAAAKTKDRTLFQAICSSIFSTIIDQAPFAIEDLIKEMKETDFSDSGQSSEGDDEAVERKELVKQMNGIKSHAHDNDHELQSDDSDTELQYDDDDDTTPVLQFDYAALADKLLQLSSCSNTPSQNRQILYKIIKVLRDLSEGIFPQDDYPEEVSTDEDDDNFDDKIMRFTQT